MENDMSINLMTMSKDLPPEVLTCIEISHDFKVACYVESTKVNILNWFWTFKRITIELILLNPTKFKEIRKFENSEF